MRPVKLTKQGIGIVRQLTALLGLLSGLCFIQALGGNLQFQPDTLDVQMGTTNTALIAVVTGNLKVTLFLFLILVFYGQGNRIFHRG